MGVGWLLDFVVFLQLLIFGIKCKFSVMDDMLVVLFGYSLNQYGFLFNFFEFIMLKGFEENLR